MCYASPCLHNVCFGCEPSDTSSEFYEISTVWPEGSLDLPQFKTSSACADASRASFMRIARAENTAESGELDGSLRANADRKSTSAWGTSWLNTTLTPSCALRLRFTLMTRRAPLSPAGEAVDFEARKVGNCRLDTRVLQDIASLEVLVTTWCELTRS